MTHTAPAKTLSTTLHRATAAGLAAFVTLTLLSGVVDVAEGYRSDVVLAQAASQPLAQQAAPARQARKA